MRDSHPVEVYRSVKLNRYYTSRAPRNRTQSTAGMDTGRARQTDHALSDALRQKQKPSCGSLTDSWPKIRICRRPIRDTALVHRVRLEEDRPDLDGDRSAALHRPRADRRAQERRHERFGPKQGTPRGRSACSAPWLQVAQPAGERVRGNRTRARAPPRFAQGCLLIEQPASPVITRCRVAL